PGPLSETPSQPGFRRRRTGISRPPSGRPDHRLRRSDAGRTGRLRRGRFSVHGLGFEANACQFRLVIAQGQVWWVELPEPSGSEPGFRRPVVIVQGDAFNRSALRTVVCVALTSNLRWANAPGNVLLSAQQTGLPRDSVVNV